MLVGRVDADGNMVDGVRHPNLAAPIGTHTGWNLRRDGFGEGGQCAGTGSFVPFASDRAERDALGDPRPSLAERYPTRAEYVRMVTHVADDLVRDRLLLPHDAKTIVDLARTSSVGDVN